MPLTGPSASQHGNIMIVDDNPANLKLLEDMLRQHDYEVRAFPRGRLALAAAAQEPPDLILLDINMPVMSGREVLKAISDDQALCHLPVVVMTTSTEENEIYEMYRLRCNSYVTKPVNFDRFVQVIGQLCDYWLGLVSLPRK